MMMQMKMNLPMKFALHVRVAEPTTVPMTLNSNESDNVERDDVD